MTKPVACLFAILLVAPTPVRAAAEDDPFGLGNVDNAAPHTTKKKKKKKPTKTPDAQEAQETPAPPAPKKRIVLKHNKPSLKVPKPLPEADPDAPVETSHDDNNVPPSLTVDRTPVAEHEEIEARPARASALPETGDEESAIGKSKKRIVVVHAPIGPDSEATPIRAPIPVDPATRRDQPELAAHGHFALTEDFSAASTGNSYFINTFKLSLDAVPDTLSFYGNYLAAGDLTSGLRHFIEGGAKLNFGVFRLTAGGFMEPTATTTHAATRKLVPVVDVLALVAYGADLRPELTFGDRHFAVSLGLFGSGTKYTFVYEQGSTDSSQDATQTSSSILQFVMGGHLSLQLDSTEAQVGFSYDKYVFDPSTDTVGNYGPNSHSLRGALRSEEGVLVAPPAWEAWGGFKQHFGLSWAIDLGGRYVAYSNDPVGTTLMGRAQISFRIDQHWSLALQILVQKDSPLGQTIDPILFGGGGLRFEL